MTRWTGLSGRLTRTAVNSNIITSYNYTLGAAGERLSVTEPSQITTYTYDSLYRLTGETITETNGEITAYSYTYDAVGNRLTKTENGLLTSYNYNALNQLISENKPVKTIVETAPEAEQSETETEEPGIETEQSELDEEQSELDEEQTEFESEQPESETVQPELLAEQNEFETEKPEPVFETTYVNVTYEYDPNGNLIRTISPESSALYIFNSRGQLTEATVQSGNNVTTETYTYDYAGNRTSKTTNGEYTKYLLDINGSLTQVLAELDLYGNVKAYFTRGDELISQDREGEISFYIYDGHGNVRFLTNASGNVTDSYDYDAFGNLLNRTGDTENNYLYCGEQFDSTTGLYYLRARYMNPSTGTFISQDAYQGSVYDPVSLHKYLYANANPVMYSDPSGYASSLIEQQAVFAIGEILAAAYVTYSLSSLKVGMDIIGSLRSINDKFISQHLDIIIALNAVSVSFTGYNKSYSDSVNDTVVDSATEGTKARRMKNKTKTIQEILTRHLTREMILLNRLGRDGNGKDLIQKVVKKEVGLT